MNCYIVGDFVKWVDDFALLTVYTSIGKHLESILKANRRPLISLEKDWGGNSQINYLHILFYLANKHNWFLELKKLREWKPLHMDTWWSGIYIVQLGKMIRYFENIELLSLYAMDIKIHQLGTFFEDVINYASQKDQIEFILVFTGLQLMAFQQSLIHYLHPNFLQVDPRRLGSNQKKINNWERFARMVQKNSMFMNTFGCPEKAKCPSVLICKDYIKDHVRFT